MKIVFFGPKLSRAHADRRARILSSLIEGVVEDGHHVVVLHHGDDAPKSAFAFIDFLEYDDWSGARDLIEKECSDASAICVASGFAEGPEAVEWLLELPVPARAYYELDPWETLASFEASGASACLRSDQIPAFHIVFSIAGGAGTERFKSTWGVEEAVTLSEAIDPAIFHPRSPSDEFACDLLVIADRDATAESAVDGFVLKAAKAVPDRRFLVAGKGWESATGWPDNVELVYSGGDEVRATLFSSARVVLIPTTDDAVDYAMPIDLLEAAACASACAVLDRPGLSTLFKIGEEILVPASSEDLVAFLAGFDASRLLAMGNRAEKRVVGEYTKLRIATKFEQRLARKFYRGQHS